MSKGSARAGQGVAAGDSGVEEPGAVEIGGGAEVVRGPADRHDLGLGKDLHAAAAIVGGTGRHHGGRRQDDVAGRLEGGADVVGGEQAALADVGELDTGIGRRRAGFMPGDVRLLPDDDVVAGLAQQPQADLVGHGSAGREQRGFLAEQLGDPLLQPIDRGVLTVLVVADLGPGHGRACIDGDGWVTVSERRSTLSITVPFGTSFSASRIAGNPSASPAFTPLRGGYSCAASGL